MKIRTFFPPMNRFSAKSFALKSLMITAIFTYATIQGVSADTGNLSNNEFQTEQKLPIFRAAQATPSITLTTTSLTGLNYTVGYGPSTFLFFKVSGSNLTGNITVTPPTDYEISLSAANGYQSTAITLTKSGSSVASTAIFVRLKKNLAIGDYNGENIVVATTGTTSQNVSCSGTVLDLPSIAITAVDGVCSGSNFSLSATNQNAQNLYWLGPNNFYSIDPQPSFTNATPSLNGTYTLTGSISSGVNIITNGDFEAGKSGFSSAYTYNNTSLQNEGTYAVIANPQSLHPNFSACPNYNDYGSLQMVVNGAQTAGAKIWYQTVTVKPNTQYQFTYYVQSVHTDSPSIMQLYAKGIAVGPSYTASSTTCLWKKFVYVWNSGSNTTVELSLINQNTAPAGNDFALDNISFQETYSVSNSTNVVVNSTLPASLSIAAPSTSVNEGSPITLTATPTNGGFAPSYQWKVNGVIAGSNSNTLSYTPANNDVVTCALTSSLLCASGSPASSNAVTITYNLPTDVSKNTSKELYFYAIGKTIYVNNSTKEINTLSIYDISGKVIQTALYEANTTTAIFTQLKTGIYFVKTATNNGDVIARVIIK